MIACTLAAGTVACSPGVEVRWTNGDTELVGSLIVPDSPGPHPLVVYVGGSGNSHRGLKVAREHARHLSRMGLAVFSYDKRGTGDSGGDWHDVGLEELAQDLAAVLPQLMHDPNVDPSRVVLMGLSQGAWVALLAEQLQPGSRGLVWLSGAPMTPAEQGHAMVELAMRPRGWDDESIAKATALDRRIVDVYRKDAGWDEVRRAVDAARSEPWFEDSGVGIQDRDGGNWRWYRKFMDYDPVPQLASLDVPLFAVYGENDVLVPAKRSIAILDSIRAEYGTQISTRLVPGVGHDLRPNRDSDWSPDYWRVLEDGLRDMGVLKRE